MSNSHRSSADHLDIHRRLQFLTMLLFSLVFAAKTGLYFAESKLETFLAIAARCLVAMAFIALAVTVFWKLRYIPRQERAGLLESDDSFANQMMNRASKISWASTLILLFFIGTIINKDTTVLPASFYVDLTAFFMLITFSVSFLWLFRTVEEREQQNAGL